MRKSKFLILKVIETKKPILTGVLVFAIVALLTQLLAYQRHLIFKEAQDVKVIEEANSVRNQLVNSLSYSLSATKTLAFIVSKYGVPENFDSVAIAILQSNQYIDAIELTQRGIVTHVYPFEENKVALGYDVLGDNARSEEAMKSLQRNNLFFAGPFRLVQGYVGVVGRLPIFRGGDFLGFSVVIIKMETLISAGGMDRPNREFSYQLSKINPITGQEEFFLPGVKPEHQKFFSIDVPDGEWKLYVIPGADYYERSSWIVISLLGLMFSATAGVFAWYLARQPEKLNRLVKEKASEVVKLQRNAIITIERVSDAFLSLDRSWRFTYMNQKAGEIFDRDPQTLIGKHFWTEYPESVGQPFYVAYHQAMEEQRYIHFEGYYKPKDQWFENHIYPSPDGISIYLRNVTEVRKATQRLEASEKYFRTLIEKSTDAVLLLDKNQRIVYHSPSTTRITGYESHELHNRLSLGFVNPKERKYLGDLIESIKDKPGASVKATFPFSRKDGQTIWIGGTYTNWLQDTNIQAVVLNYHDITDRVEAEEKIKSANRFYNFTSRINQMMIHAETEQTVFEEVCKIAVEVGKFKMAWVGKIDQKKNGIVAVCSAGNVDGRFVDDIVSIDDPVVHAEPTASAIRTGAYVYCNDIENDESMKPWAKQALDSGFRAFIALPIRKGEKVIAVFHLYSDHAFCFDDNEILLLEEASTNISFTLSTLEHEEMRRAAEEQIEREKIFSDFIINALPGIFYFYDRNGKFLRWNRNFELVSGYSAEEIRDMHPLDFFQGDEKETLSTKITEVFERGHAEVIGYFTSKSGEKKPFFFNGIKVNFGEADYLMGVGIDVTERIQAEKNLVERTEEIQRLTQYLQEVREEERTRISREIHDVIGQQLTALKMDASWLRKRFEEQQMLDRVNAMIGLIDETIKTVRRISSELRPGMLDDLGLISTLEWQTGEFTKNTGINAVFSGNVSEDIDKNLATNIFRVYQESLTNVARHSHATQVETSIEVSDNFVKMIVRDNGIGFDPEEVRTKKSLGILGMKERARMFGGELIFTANEPSGTTVVLSVPMKTNKTVHA